jgi:hypothetical protein
MSFRSIRGPLRSRLIAHQELTGGRFSRVFERSAPFEARFAGFAMSFRLNREPLRSWLMAHQELGGAPVADFPEFLSA